MNTYEFGKFLAQMRKEKGLTQLQLAEKLNVTDKAVSRWETGKNYPDIDMFEDLSNILDVSVSELLEGKRIDKEKLFSVSENQIIEQIKTKKRSSKKYRIIICIILIVAILSGYIAMRESGVFDGVIYNEIPCYSNDTLTILNNIDGYITHRPKAKGDFIIDYGYFFMEPDKTTNDIFYLSGTCENGRAFYVNTMYDGQNADNSRCFIGEYRKNQNTAIGITMKNLKSIVTQLDLSTLEKYEKYELSIENISTFNNTNLNSNDHQKSIKKFLFTNNTLMEYNKATLSGEFLLITIKGYDNGYGHIVAYIFYEK